MIPARHLTKRFGGVTAVEDLSLDVREGEVLGAATLTPPFVQVPMRVWQ